MKVRTKLTNASVEMEEEDFKDFNFEVAHKEEQIRMQSPTLKDIKVKGNIDLELGRWEYEAQFDLNISDISLLVDFFLNLNEDKLSEF